VKRLAIAAALLAALAALWVWWSSDRRRLAARLDQVVELFEKSRAEDQLTSFGKTRAIVELFAPGFVVLAKPYQGSITDRQQLAAIVQSYRDGSERIDISDSERSFEIDAARGVAESAALFAVSGGRGGGGERFRARIAWARIEGAWRIQEFEIVEVLEPGGRLGF
jgi:hypothetical protein